MEREYLQVSELNQYIKDVISSGFPQPVWVCGEIQQYDRNRGKNHIFFELVEKDSKTKSVVARIGLVIFAGRKSFIQQTLKRSENAFELKDDIEVKFACKVDFYAPHGAVRLIVEDIDATYEELKSKGVEFEMTPTKQPWGGTLALFNDPDGNTFYLDPGMEHS